MTIIAIKSFIKFSAEKKLRIKFALFFPVFTAEAQLAGIDAMAFPNGILIKYTQ